MKASHTARRYAGGIAALGLLILLLRVYLRVQMPETVLEALSYLSQYFTILTNALTVILLGLIAGGASIKPRLLSAIVVAITCVGLIYHAVLAHLLDLSGLALLADHGVHTVIPILTVFWWLAFAEKPKLNAATAIAWVVWPLLYCVYILLRASFSGFYPYPFLNLPELGTGTLAMNIAGLLVAFVLIGSLLTLISKFVGHRL